MDTAVCNTEGCGGHGIVVKLPHADASYCLECCTQMQVTHSPECDSLVRCDHCGLYMTEEELADESSPAHV